MFCQRASPREDGLVVWDYHVAALVFTSTAPAPASLPIMLDLDTRLPFPCPAHEYLKHTLRPQQAVFADGSRAARYFRVVCAPAFLRHFSSDRSHMLARRDPSSATCGSVAASNRSGDPATEAPSKHSTQVECSGEPAYTATPPITPCIRGADSEGAHMLPRYWDMQQERVGMAAGVRSFDELDPGPYGCVLTEQQMQQLCAADVAASGVSSDAQPAA